MAVRKIKGSWWVDFMIRYRRYRYRSPYNTREGALALEARLRGELVTHGKILSLTTSDKDRTQVPTLKEFAPRWMEGYVCVNNRPKEQKQKLGSVNRHLIPFFGNTRLDQITVEQIERFKGIKQKEGLHPKTINNHLVVLHKLLVTAKDWSLIEEVPRMKQLKVPDPPFRHLTLEEAEKLISVISDLTLRSMVIIALRTGLRYSELTGLQWEDVDLEKGTITVRRSLVEGDMGSTKNNRIRHIPLTSDAKETLLKIRKSSGFVFVSPFRPNSPLPCLSVAEAPRPSASEDRGGATEGRRLLIGVPVPYEAARRRLKKYAALAGIPSVSWHDLRHTFASQLVAARAPILAVQKLLGHADIKMTMRYSHLEPDVLRDVVNLLTS